MRKTALAITASLIVLSGCGGSDGDSEPADAPAESPADEATESDGGDDAPPVGDASTYSAELEDGATLTVRLDVDESDPAVAPFVAFREQVGATDSITWLVGTLEVPADYDDSTGPPTGRFLTFVPPGGELISDTNETSAFACGSLDDWFGQPSGDDAEALTEAYIAIIDEACNGQTFGVPAEIGVTTDYAMVVDGDAVPEFESLFAGLLTELQPIG